MGRQRLRVVRKETVDLGVEHLDLRHAERLEHGRNGKGADRVDRIDDDLEPACADRPPASINGRARIFSMWYGSRSSVSVRAQRLVSDRLRLDALSASASTSAPSSGPRNSPLRSSSLSAFHCAGLWLADRMTAPSALCFKHAHRHARRRRQPAVDHVAPGRLQRGRDEARADVARHAPVAADDHARARLGLARSQAPNAEA